MRILVVEDEPKLNQGLVKGLQGRGYAVDSALDGEEGERMACWENYDLIVLDIMLPKQDGLAVCRNLRQAGKNTPIIFLTAKDTVEDRITGLDMGGDDYLVKPFAFDELMARIRTLMRRPALTTKDVLELDELRLDTRTQKLAVKEREIGLTQREYGLMEYLLRNQGTVLTQQDIIDHVWDRNYDSFSNVVNVHIKNLRKKLPEKYARKIETVWGKGYRLA